MLGTRVANGNRTFARQGRWIDPTVAIVIVNYPRNLRFIAGQLSRTGPVWMSEALETVAKWWGEEHRESNAKILTEVVAHTNQLTPMQISCIEAALRKLQEDSDV